MADFSQTYARLPIADTLTWDTFEDWYQSQLPEIQALDEIQTLRDLGLENPDAPVPSRDDIAIIFQHNEISYTVATENRAKKFADSPYVYQGKVAYTAEEQELNEYLINIDPFTRDFETEEALAEIVADPQLTIQYLNLHGLTQTFADVVDGKATLAGIADFYARLDSEYTNDGVNVMSDVYAAGKTQANPSLHTGTKTGSLDQLKIFLTENLGTGIDIIDRAFLQEAHFGQTSLSGVSYQMLVTFVRGMAENGIGGAYAAIENLINDFANPLQKDPKEQVGAVLDAFNEFFEHIFGKSNYPNNSRWPNFAAKGVTADNAEAFVQGLFGDGESMMLDFFSDSISSAPVFSELQKQTQDLIANMNEQMREVTQTHDLRQAYALMMNLVSVNGVPNDKSFAMLCEELGVTPEQIARACPRVELRSGIPGRDGTPHIYETVVWPERPSDIDAVTWSKATELAKGKGEYETNLSTTQMHNYLKMPLALGLGLAAGAINPFLGIAVGAGIAASFSYEDYSATREALERGTAYNAASHATGIPLASDEQVALLDANFDAAVLAGRIGIASSLLIPPGLSGYSAAGTMGALGAWAVWMGDSRQNSADHMTRSEMFRYYDTETGRYDLTAEQVAKIHQDAELQVLTGLVFTVSLGAVMGVAGEAGGNSLKKLFPPKTNLSDVKLKLSLENPGQGSLVCSDGTEIQVTLSPGKTPQEVLVHLPDGNTVTARVGNPEPMAIVRDVSEPTTKATVKPQAKAKVAAEEPHEPATDEVKANTQTKTMTEVETEAYVAKRKIEVAAETNPGKVVYLLRNNKTGEFSTFIGDDAVHATNLDYQTDSGGGLDVVDHTSGKTFHLERDSLVKPGSTLQSMSNQQLIKGPKGTKVTAVYKPDPITGEVYYTLFINKTQETQLCRQFDPNLIKVTPFTSGDGNTVYEVTNKQTGQKKVYDYDPRSVEFAKHDVEFYEDVAMTGTFNTERLVAEKYPDHEIYGVYKPSSDAGINGMAPRGPGFEDWVYMFDAVSQPREGYVGVRESERVIYVKLSDGEIVPVKIKIMYSPKPGQTEMSVADFDMSYEAPLGVEIDVNSYDESINHFVARRNVENKYGLTKWHDSDYVADQVETGKYNAELSAARTQSNIELYKVWQEVVNDTVWVDLGDSANGEISFLGEANPNLKVSKEAADALYDLSDAELAEIQSYVYSKGSFTDGAAKKMNEKIENHQGSFVDDKGETVVPVNDKIFLLRTLPDGTLELRYVDKKYTRLANWSDGRIEEAISGSTAALRQESRKSKLYYSVPGNVKVVDVVPQGFTPETWNQLQLDIYDLLYKYGLPSDLVLAQGSRVSGTPRPNSDLDIAVVLSPEQYVKMVDGMGQGMDVMSRDVLYNNAGLNKDGTLGLDNEKVILKDKIVGEDFATEMKSLSQKYGIDVGVSFYPESSAFYTGSVRPFQSHVELAETVGARTP